MSHISADDVRKVAKLARLNLPDDKIATYTGQLESILGAKTHPKNLHHHSALMLSTDRGGKMHQPINAASVLGVSARNPGV